MAVAGIKVPASPKRDAPIAMTLIAITAGFLPAVECSPYYLDRGRTVPKLSFFGVPRGGRGAKMNEVIRVGFSPPGLLSVCDSRAAHPSCAQKSSRRHRSPLPRRKQRAHMKTTRHRQSEEFCCTAHRQQ